MIFYMNIPIDRDVRYKRICNQFIDGKVYFLV